MAPYLECFEEGGWHFAQAPTMYTSRVLVLAKLTPFVGPDPVREPGTVYFEYGSTREDALGRLRSELAEVPV